MLLLDFVCLITTIYNVEIKKIIRFCKEMYVKSQIMSIKPRFHENLVTYFYKKIN